MRENPIASPEGNTELDLGYASATIEVLKEEEAFSFLNLVADVGGVLGLFIGFNFLMIWEEIIGAFTSLPFKIYFHVHACSIYINNFNHDPC